MPANETIVLDVFRAIEERDRETLCELYHDDVELIEPSSLPYGGTFRGKALVAYVQRPRSADGEGVFESPVVGRHAVQGRQVRERADVHLDTAATLDFPAGAQPNERSS